MELPVTRLPSWPSCYYWNSATRPFLTIHRSLYNEIPRLSFRDLECFEIASRPTLAHSKCGHESSASKSTYKDEKSLKNAYRASCADTSWMKTGHSSTFLLERKPLFSGSNIGLSRRRSSNCACTVRYGHEVTAVLPCNQKFDSVALFEADVNELPRLRPIIWNRDAPSNEGLPGYFNLGKKKVVSISSCDSDANSSDPARIAFGLQDYVVVTNLGAERHLTWGGVSQVRNLRSAIFSESCPDELMTLDADGLKILQIDSDFVIRDSIGCDVWPLKVEYHYFKAKFGSHPRTALLSSQAGLHRVDMRSGNIYGKIHSGSCLELDNRAELLFDVWKDWRISRTDRGIFIFEKHPRVPFWSIIGTQQRLAVLDERMTRNPVLEWCLTTSHQSESSIACVASTCQSRDDLGDLIALCAPRLGCLDIFHMQNVDSLEKIVPGRCQQASIASFSTSGASSSGLLGYGYRRPSQAQDSIGFDRIRSRVIPLPSLVWSDLPLSHVPLCAPGDYVRGITFFPHKGIPKCSRNENVDEIRRDFCLTCVQVSESGVVLGQVIACGIFADDERSFEPGPSTDRCFRMRSNYSPYRDEYGCYGILDTPLALREAQLANSKKKVRASLLDQPNAGIRVLGSTKKLHVVNVMDLRRRLSCAFDDDRDVESLGCRASSRFPRPFVSDRPLLASFCRDRNEIEGDAMGATRMQHLLQKILAIPRTLCEIAQIIRTGNPHSKSPVEISTLREILVASPYITSYVVRCSTLDTVCAYEIFHTDPSLTADFTCQLDKVVSTSPFGLLMDELQQIYYRT